MVLAAEPAYGFELSVGVGQSAVSRNTLLDVDEGEGLVKSFRLNLTHAQNPQLSFGILGMEETYELSYFASGSEAEVSSSGEFIGQKFGGEATISFPGNFVSTYLRFSLLGGKYRYEILKTTVEGAEESSESTSYFKTIADLYSLGYQTTLSFRYGDELGFYFEVADRIETMQLESIRAGTVTAVGGEIAARDGGEATVGESLQVLVGERFFHHSQSLSLGVDWRF